MATFLSGIDPRCPLCGSRVMSQANGGRLVVGDLHAVPLWRERRQSQAFLVCDDCAILTDVEGDVA